jgi:hypothetical protein
VESAPELLSGEPGEQLGRVAHAVEPVGTGVGHHRSVGSEQLHPDLVAGEEQLLLALRATARLAEVDRDRPPRRRRGGRLGIVLGVQEAALAQHELVTFDRGRHEGEAALPDPAVHDLPCRFAGDLLHGVPQVARLGVAVGVRVQVVPHAVAEAVLAEVLLQHAQQRATLDVGQHVEHALGVLRGHDLVLHRPGGEQ